MKDKQGNKITFKEFKKRWKNGMQEVTQLQISKQTLNSTYIVLLGLVCGIITTALTRVKNMWWWVLIILVGSLFLTVLQQIGNYQKYFNLKKVDDTMKQLEKELEETKKDGI